VVWANSQFATVCFFLCIFSAKATGRTVRQIWANEGSKRVVPRNEVPFGCVNDVALNIGDHDKILQKVRTTNETSWVFPWLTQTNPRWRRPPSLILEKYQ